MAGSGGSSRYFTAHGPENQQTKPAGAGFADLPDDA
jgi:hypothetical protein